MTPTEFQTRSLVVGRITAIDWQGRAEWPLPRASLRIDGILYHNVVRNGHFAIALKPGMHKLQALVRSQGSAVLTRPLNKILRVKIRTNVDAGLLILWFNRDQHANAYHVLQIDNRNEMRAYLKQTYPHVWARVARRPFVLADQSFLDLREIRLLREEIIKRLVLHDPMMWPLVAGAVGTVASLDSRGKQKLAVIHMFDSKSLGNFRSCSRSRGHLDCILEENDLSRAMDFDGRRLIYRELPPGFEPRRIFRSRDNTLYVVDSYLHILSLPSGRRRWHRYNGAGRSKKLPQSEAVYLCQAANGIFINTSGHDGVILFRHRSSGYYSHVPPPGGDVRMWNIVAVPGGILMGGTRGGWRRRSYGYFRPSDGTNWEPREIPATSCTEELIPVVRRESAPAIGVLCNGHVYLTADGGRHWKRREDRLSVPHRIQHKKKH